MNDLFEMNLRLKSGREYKFSCEAYHTKKDKLTGALLEVSFEKVVGECPVYFRVEDVEAISRIIKKKEGADNADR